MRNAFFMAFGLAVAAIGGAANAQAPTMMPITELDAATRKYVTASGAIISTLGELNPDRLIGRAMPCRAGENATYTPAPSTAYPMPEGTRYVADATSRQEPLTILAQGTINGQVGAGPLSAEANADKLTRLDISEAVRLSINTSDANGALSRDHIRFLNSLDGARPAGYNHWCVITSASVWNIRYESYDKKRVVFGLSEGLWIATANGDYARNSSAVVPYQVVTIAITPYPATWVQAQAAAITLTDAPGAVAPPPGTPLTIHALTGRLAANALAEGDRLTQSRNQ